MIMTMIMTTIMTVIIRSFILRIYIAPLTEERSQSGHYTKKEDLNNL